MVQNLKKNHKSLKFGLLNGLGFFFLLFFKKIFPSLMPPTTIDRISYLTFYLFGNGKSIDWILSYKQNS